jgi:hypothetical protein
VEQIAETLHPNVQPVKLEQMPYNFDFAFRTMTANDNWPTASSRGWLTFLCHPANFESFHRATKESASAIST